MADVFETLKEHQDPGTIRAKRSEMLLTQLYRDAMAPRFRVPHVQGMKTMFVVSLIALIAFSATLFWKFNAFIQLREDVYAKAGNLEGAVQRRANLFGNLVKLTLSHAALEHAVFSHTADVRTEIVKKIDLPKALAGVPAPGAAGVANPGGNAPLTGEWGEVAKQLLGNAEGMEASLGRLLAVVEQYPDIQSSKTYQQMMTSLVDMEDLIATRRIELHDATREYNMQISKFPWKLLAHITEFKRVDYFNSGKEGGDAPILTSEMFQQLVPLSEAKGEDP